MGPPGPRLPSVRCWRVILISRYGLTLVSVSTYLLRLYVELQWG